MALDFFAGWVGGCAGVMVGHPLDTVKVHLQTQDARNPKYTGSMHCIRSLVAKEGVRGLYRGLSSPLMGVAAINAIVFGVQSKTQKNFYNPDLLRSHFMAGGIAGFVQSFICSPIELAKTRMQVASGSGGVVDCMKQIYQNGGIRGVFRGINLTIAREVPSFGTYFLTYEYLTRSNGDAPVTTMTMMLAGGCAGTASWCITYPVDVIKTRFQLDGADGVLKYKNSFDCLRKSVAAEGYGFLVRGLTPTLVRAFPVNAAIFTVVTWTVRILESDTLEKNINSILSKSPIVLVSADIA